MAETQRLDKLVASSGEFSRKQAKELIRGGRVAVNGAVAVSGEQRVGYGDTVTVDGTAVRNQPHLYLMLNKPAGVVCSTDDPLHPTVLELVPKEFRRRGLFPAGRLDLDTEGLVILTDDGDFAHRMLAPASHIPKIYEARLNRPFDFQAVQRAFGQGLALDGGDVCSPAELRLVQDGERPLASLTIYEGMYHQVKRMFQRFQLDVVHLRRVQIGSLRLDADLAPGCVREILHKELGRIC